MSDPWSSLCSFESLSSSSICYDSVCISFVSFYAMGKLKKSSLLVGKRKSFSGYDEDTWSVPSSSKWKGLLSYSAARNFACSLSDTMCLNKSMNTSLSAFVFRLALIRPLEGSSLCAIDILLLECLIALTWYYSSYRLSSVVLLTEKVKSPLLNMNSDFKGRFFKSGC